ncbi:MAG: tetratricopeptide repeat protein [Betaproteobacteria bacterium]|nr:tetratricopeptide repeat protein [Betaproteobacteria bacterium]
MTPACSEALMSELSERIATHLGLHFPRERWGELERGVREIARAAGAGDIGAMMRELSSAPLTRRQIDLLAGQFTVGETYFFRERNSFEAFQSHVLPELLQARRNAQRRLRIWSAGCCTGEEPYSIAMLLDRLLARDEEWNVTLLATDVNPAFLRKAAQGRYGEWSFRDTPASFRDHYFRKTRDGRYEIEPHIRGMVRFAYLNLAGDAYPSIANDTGAMDVIFCRNVLMYFTAERAARVIDGLHRCLLDGGWLITSPAETSNALFPQFTAAYFSGAVLYRKAARAVTPRELEQRDALPEPPWPPSSITLAERDIEQTPATQAPQGECETALGRARACANDGRLAEAAEWCAQAIAADKLNPVLHYLLASIRRERGENAEAAQSLGHALYLDPHFALAHFALGNLRLQQGRVREAERHFEHALAQLHARPRDEILPESDGLAAGRLCEIIASRKLSLLLAAELVHDRRGA